MKLAIFWPNYILFDGRKYYTAAYQPYMFTELAKHFDNTDLIAFVKESKIVDKTLNLIDTRRINMMGLPGYREPRRLLTRTGWEIRFLEIPYACIHILKLFYRRMDEWDVILLWDPLFTNQFAFLLTKFFKKFAVLYLGARYDKIVLLDSKGSSLDLKLNNKIKSLSFKLFVPLMARHMPTVVTGKEIYDLLKNKSAAIYKIASSITKKSWIDKNVLKAKSDSKNRIRLLTVSRVVPTKAIEDLLYSVCSLIKRNINCHLDIVGPIVDEEYYTSLIDKCKQLSIEKYVEFVGAVNQREQLMKYYSNADIFVLCSLSEGTPKVIPEAMAKGLPIVATNVGGIPELVQDGQTGILVAPRNVQELTAAIEKLATDNNLRRKFVENSLDKAEEYSMENQMRKFADILKDPAHKSLF